MRLGEIEAEGKEEEKAGAQSRLWLSHSWPQVAPEWGPARKRQTKQMG